MAHFRDRTQYCRSHSQPPTMHSGSVLTPCITSSSTKLPTQKRPCFSPKRVHPTNQSCSHQDLSPRRLAVCTQLTVVGIPLLASRGGRIQHFADGFIRASLCAMHSALTLPTKQPQSQGSNSSGFVSSHMRKSYCLPKGGQCLCGYTAKKTTFHLLTDRFSLHARLELPHESCRSQYYKECACLCMQGRRTEDCLSASVPPFPGTKHASTLSQEIT